MNQPQITITITPGGEVQLQSTVADHIAMYGLLEVAKDLVRENMKAKTGAVIAAPAAALSQLQKAN